MPAGQGSYEERRVFRLQLTERSSAESALRLARYLSRDRVRSGDALEDAMRDYRDLAASRQAAKSLPAAWDRLVNAPEDLLVELVTEEAEKLSGFRPSSTEVLEFLRGLRSKVAFSPNPPKPEPARPEPTRPPESKEPAPPNGRGVRYSVFGQPRSARSGSDAMVDILTALAKHDPSRLNAVAEAVRGRSRNHIARTVDEIYPARPDLARAVEFSPGWLVGLNIANREKMRIIREACRVMSLQFGKDIVIELPNVD